MKKLKYIILGILITTIACEEDTVTTIISGSVREYFTENIVSNIDLIIHDNTIDPTNPQLRQIQPYDTISFVAKIPVDNLGNFEYKTESLRKGNEYLLVYNSGDRFSIYSNEIEVGKTNNINLKLKHYNILKVKIQNNNIQADSLALFISVDNSHFDETGEIVEFLLNEQFTFSENLNTTVLSKSIPECLHTIICRYYENGKYIDNVEVEKYVSNVDTTEILIELL
jgi:hypothetical protein